MSFGRKTYDGDIFGGSFSTSERRDTIDNKSTINKLTASKRARKDSRLLDSEENSFSEEADKDRYLITYADLITLLLGLFIILYSISNVDAGKYEKVLSAIGVTFGQGENNTSVPKPETVVQKSLHEQLNSVIKENQFEKFVRLEENARGITLHIMGDILFPSGSSELNQNSLKILDKLAAVVKTLPNDIRIEGHTDNIPIKSSVYPSNWHLSVDRALNTSYYLIDKQNLNPDKVSIVGYSEYKPISNNSSIEGRTLNRRVDIVIIKNNEK